jgi:phosphoribosyl-AMP cyclohydrolase / phosphoribosyl-ATP pyrophosphohydrolase
MKLQFDKYPDNLVPVIVQDQQTGKVLMLGFMNEAAYQKTLAEGRVVFYSRSKQRLWMKGEESGNFLFVEEILADCDSDTLLIKASPAGPVCHTGADTCFGEENTGGSFLVKLESVITERQALPSENSYTSGLFASGLNRVAQKLGEEAVELVIAAKDNDRDAFLGEAADLMFHYLVLLRAKGVSFSEVEEVLRKRHR